VLAQILQDLKPGVHLLIGHPGYPSLENDALVHFEPKDVQTLGVGRNRAAETLAYTSPRIQRLVADLGIKLMSYREFCAREDLPSRQTRDCSEVKHEQGKTGD